VVRSTVGKEEHFTIHDVMFNGDGTPIMVSDKGAIPFETTLGLLREDLQSMISALDKPVLNSDDFSEGDRF